MPLDVYFRENIANVIRGNLLSVILAAAAQGVPNVEFVRGNLALAQSQCLSFGINWPGLLADLRDQASVGGCLELLEAASPMIEGKCSLTGLPFSGPRS